MKWRDFEAAKQDILTRYQHRSDIGLVGDERRVDSVSGLLITCIVGAKFACEAKQLLDMIDRHKLNKHDSGSVYDNTLRLQATASQLESTAMRAFIMRGDVSKFVGALGRVPEP